MVKYKGGRISCQKRKRGKRHVFKNDDLSVLWKLWLWFYKREMWFLPDRSSGHGVCVHRYYVFWLWWEKKWEEEIFEKFVKPSPLYSPAKRAALPDYKLMEAAEFNPPTAGGVRCPRCGSTQIQMVPRKWSLLTGFLTNKVDRVCVNCKRKF